MGLEKVCLVKLVTINDCSNKRFTVHSGFLRKVFPNRIPAGSIMPYSTSFFSLNEFYGLNIQIKQQLSDP